MLRLKNFTVTLIFRKNINWCNQFDIFYLKQVLDKVNSNGVILDSHFYRHTLYTYTLTGTQQMSLRNLCKLPLQQYIIIAIICTNRIIGDVLNTVFKYLYT